MNEAKNIQRTIVQTTDKLLLQKEVASVVTRRPHPSTPRPIPPLPQLPPGLQWPTEHFNTSKEANKEMGILTHLQRVWSVLIQKGYVTMPLLRHYYPSTAKAIDNYRHWGVHKGGLQRTLPEHIDVPRIQIGSGRPRSLAANVPSFDPHS